MEEEIKKIIESDSEIEIRELIDKIAPNWLIGTYDSYSDDYPHLTNNWKAMCKNLNTTPQKIVIVKNIPLDEKDNDKLFKPKLAICEVLTIKGYIIRREEEIVGCLECNKAIPNSIIYNQLPKDKMTLPPKWSSRCTTC